MTSRRRTFAWVLMLLVVLGTAYMVTVPMLAWSKVTTVDAQPDGARPPDQPGTTYLLVGSDSRAGLTKRQRSLFHTGDAEGSRADTIMLLHTGRGPTVLMSIPRASLVDVPGHGTATINSAYAYGGPELLVETVEGATGLRIDDYVEIGFSGVVNLVDEVGGITICPSAPMDDVRANLHVEAGCQHVGGRKALAYARSRHADQLDDVGRAAHQREVVSRTGSKVLSPATVVNPWHYWQVMLAGAASVRVGDDVSAWAFLNFANATRHVDGSSGLTCGMPLESYAFAAVHWDPVRAGRILDLIRADRTDDIDASLCQPYGVTP